MIYLTVGGEQYETEPDKDYLAYKDGKYYRIVSTKKTFYTGLSTMGSIRAAIDDDGSILAEALPLFPFNNGFESESVKSLEKMWDKFMAYRKFQAIEWYRQTFKES
jgi:hypothetical protein